MCLGVVVMAKNIYVLEIIMLEEASNDKEINNDIGELIGLIEDKYEHILAPSD